MAKALSNQEAGRQSKTAETQSIKKSDIQKNREKQGSKISLPDVPGPLEKSDGPPQFPH